jgi:RNA polymerase sigma factor (sigma-70 family)
MATSVLNGVLRHLRRIALARDGAGLTDGELLDSFVATGDEVAFESLTRRHGPMVLGVCRRVLGNEADAEDAFQATFLILVRKAADVMPRSMVGNWLYGVAHNTALKAKAMNSKRRVKEKQAGQRYSTATPAAAASQLQELLDDELSRLPDKYRVPIVLCDLEGKLIKEAARQLGWPQGTVASRLARARGLLAKRLASHGLVFSSGSLAALVLESTATAAVPIALMNSTMKAAAGGAAAAVTSAEVAALFERMMQTMLMRKLNAAAGLILLAALGLGSSLYLNQVQAQNKPAAIAAPNAEQESPKSTAKDGAKAGRLYFHLDLRIATVQPDGKDTKHLPGISQEDLQHYQSHSASLSPDGKRLAFGKAVVKNNGDGIHVFPPDKVYVRDVTKEENGEVVAEVPGCELQSWCWSPDGKKLAVTSWDSENFSRNWVVNLKSKKISEIKLPRYKAKDKEYSMSIQAWSPDGSSFLANGDGLFLVKTDGTDAKRLIEAGTNIMVGTCRFSPDGKKVLFVGVTDKASTKLYVTDVQGGKTRTVVDAVNFTDMHACWSPDGRRIAYSVMLLDENGDPGKETTLFVMDADGNNTTTVRTELHEPRRIRLRLTDWR